MCVSHDLPGAAFSSTVLKLALCFRFLFQESTVLLQRFRRVSTRNRLKLPLLSSLSTVSVFKERKGYKSVILKKYRVLGTSPWKPLKFMLAVDVDLAVF